MMNNFKYAEGDMVVCIDITPENHEGLEAFAIYTVVGANIIGDDTIYAVKDSLGDIHYSIDRFTKDPSELKPQEPEFDIVDKPEHYNSYKGFEVIDIMEQVVTGVDGIKAVCLGNVVKYVLRFKFKNGLEDLKKARFYLDKMIKTMEGEENETN